MEPKRIGVGVGVLILNNRGKVLLGQRHENEQKPSGEFKAAGHWTMPGGKLDFCESFEEAALRETEEETGLKLTKAEVFCVNNEVTEDVHFVTIGLVGSGFSGEPQVCEPDKITVWDWFDPNDLPAPMYKPSEKLLKNYQKQKFYIEQ